MKIMKWLGGLLLLAVLIGGAMWGMNRMYRGMFGNNHYYQRSRAYTTQDGLLNQKMRSPQQMKRLTQLTHGTRYTGNTSLDQAARTYRYRVGKDDISNFMGTDAKLQLYTTSKLMTTAKVRVAASFWNRVAGQPIVQVVQSAKQSDEVIHDAQPKAHDQSLGGQTYDRQGMVFYPKNWRSSGLAATEKSDWQTAVLIREIGHALGIPSLAGGRQGTNAFDQGKITAEVMSYWSVGSAAPAANRQGITSTTMDGAALALAGLSWRRPQRLASWVFTQHPVIVHVHDDRVTTK
ncbi:zinc metalloprotease [Levilactobacillus angrenensis]|uniref:Peptidase M10 metallopeptidase domain-containing protein n=1 Tax=Levilactobacillus angrenensis TaxID=2486020 RepID=A0ABW1U8F1_9LACO|nr:hypothetical protein [Levilactobacillus angrenensis]